MSSNKIKVKVKLSSQKYFYKISDNHYALFSETDFLKYLKKQLTKV